MPPQKALREFRTAFATYTAVREVGAGGAGIVYEVRETEGERLALKCLRAGVDSGKLKRFKNEISFCSRSNHRNIVKVTDYGVLENNGRAEPFYLMPFYDATLRELIRHGIDPARVLEMYDQILSGVDASHLSGVVHRDLKPENILLEQNTGIFVVADFGIARFQEEELLTAVETRNQDRLANFVYAAPEQRIRGNEVGIRADIFALGLILNEMFTGTVPLGTGYRRIADTSPEHAYLDSVVENMIQQDPANRPDSIRTVKETLLARGNEFVQLQRLDRLRHEVVPDAEIDDPFIRDPIHIIGVDFQGRRLTFRLSAAPNGDWVRAFQNQGNYQCFVGWEPYRYQFQGDSAFIHAIDNENSYQPLVEYTKRFVANANAAYAELVRNRHRAELERRRQELRDQITAEEKRQRILSRIQI